MAETETTAPAAGASARAGAPAAVDPAIAGPAGVPRFGEFVAMMAGLMALTALSIDIMLPALPRIGADFRAIGENAPQLVVTAYVLGFAAGQIVYGPLSDRYGRKPVLFVGLILYAAASFLCLVAGTFETLLAARALQGVANAAPRVIAIAVVRDVYGGRRMAEVMSFVMMVFIIVPILAPTVGGGFLLVGSWHLIFAFLGVVAIAILAWVGLRLPETRPQDLREPLSLAWLAGAFGTTIRTPQTLGYTLATGGLFGCLMGYINSSEQIFTDIYGVGGWFPILFGGVAAALALASFLNSRLVMRVGMRRLSHGALIGFVVTGLAHLAIRAVFGPPPLVVFVALLALALFFFGIVMPNFNALAMEPMGRIAGTASSFVGAMTTGLGATLGWYIGQHYDGTAAPLVAGFAACGTASLALALATERGRLFRATR
ncbi:MAG: multidrug effflux MFS transporter [Azospirillaceae bacterium]